jgi:polyisoprenoid-binding protein YceI
MLALALWLMGCNSGAEDAAEGGGGPGDSVTDAGTSGSGDNAGGVQGTIDGADDSGTDETATDSADGDGPASTASAGSATEADEVALSPDNTDIVFIGTHAPPADPDPRTCEFTDFAGTATVADGALTAVEVTIKTEGITTFKQQLTDHLRNPDFFNALEYPEAQFKSTSIEAGEDGTVNITGDLTLLAETNPVTFPATVSTADGLSLTAEFTIDRTEWGMTARQDGVAKEVTLQIRIGG